MKIGIDAGGTLTKMVMISDDDNYSFSVRPTSNVNQLIKELNNMEDVEVYLTGGQSVFISENIKHKSYLSIEFDATYVGLKKLMARDGVNLEKFVYLNVGTGTSFHQVDHDMQVRVGGTGVGGGTLMGLSYLLTGLQTYKEIVEEAEKGTRDTLDLKVHHIFKGGPSPLPPDLTASNFANVKLGHYESATKADKLASVIGLVAETVTSFGVTLANGFGTKDMVFLGSTLNDNTVMRDVIYSYGPMKGIKPYIIEHGEFSGALGSILVFTE